MVVGLPLFLDIWWCRCCCRVRVRGRHRLCSFCLSRLAELDPEAGACAVVQLCGVRLFGLCVAAPGERSLRGVGVGVGVHSIVESRLVTVGRHK